MSESVLIEIKKQNRQKPPLSVARIAGEILAGWALGLVSLLLVLHIGDWLIGPNEPLAFLFLILFFACCPLLYGIGCALGVYLIGSIGKQTGSFSVSLVGGFLLGFIVVLPSLSLFGSRKVTVDLVPSLLLFLLPPIAATICFNLNLRYKEPQPAIH